MDPLRRKEWRLSASPLSFWFLGFALLSFLPGYPILMAAFFICFGLFQSFQTMRENGDILYSCLLPVAKREIVKSKFRFCCEIEGIGFALLTVITLLRMTVLADAALYRQNALMPANLFFLGWALLIFGCFNALFVGGFFKTAYGFAKPLIAFIAVSLVVIAGAETLPHLPGCEGFAAVTFADHIPEQIAGLLVGASAYLLLTTTACRRAAKRFEQLDL